MAPRYYILKNCSTFYRLTQIHYANVLRPYGLGAGQQYFLWHIAANPGVSMAEIAGNGAYDNGTVTRAVRKLEESGHIRMEPDARDRRSKRLYITEEGEALLEPIRRMRAEWLQAVAEDFTDEEKAQVNALLARLAENARLRLKEEQERAEHRA